MVRTDYTIKTSGFADFAVEYNTGDINNWTRNETATFTFEFPTFHEDLTVTDAYTAGTVEGYTTVTVEAGATLTIPEEHIVYAQNTDIQGTVTGGGLLSIQGDFASAFNKYHEWAGSWATMRMLEHTLKYRMQFPESEPIESLVWGIEPNQDLQDRNVVGVWGLVENIENERNQALSTNRYSVDVTVLAPIDEYDTINGVESDLVI